jgi:hypothetical protein
VKDQVRDKREPVRVKPLVGTACIGVTCLRCAHELPLQLQHDIFFFFFDETSVPFLVSLVLSS